MTEPPFQARERLTRMGFLCALLVLAALSLGGWFGPDYTHTKSKTFNKPVRKIEISLDEVSYGGTNVVVKGTGRADLKVTYRLSYNKGDRLPDVSANYWGDTKSVSVDDERGSGDSHVERIEVLVPDKQAKDIKISIKDHSDGSIHISSISSNIKADISGADLEAEHVGGKLSVEGYRASMKLRNVSADLKLALEDEPDSVFWNDKADIDGVGLRSSRARVEIEDGHLQLGWSVKPIDVKLKSHDGDINVQLPKRTYNLKVKSKDGESEVDGLRDRDSSRHKIRISSDYGDLKVQHA